MRDDKERLLDILEVINFLETHLPKDKSLGALREFEFMGVVRYLEIIGEACRTLSIQFKEKHNMVPWRQLANMRNVLIHQYFNVDTEKVEKTIKEDLPRLKTQIEKILENYK